ncbi:MAG: hypothetical protein B6U72_05275 [Candidatus Altiarchaeales archaeon ex4484_2]|nr:MAG: hypothetical protein B6U72_05275 [Candidatus Altiarchaeales archaeon ex4484_2]
MRISTSLSKRIIEASPGEVLNRFIARRRRMTLFFEDIVGEYVLECERGGFGSELADLSRKWAELTLDRLTPHSIRQLPPGLVVRYLLSKTWSNLGIVDRLSLQEDGGVVELRTRNESITRVIGGNLFMAGFFNGTVNALFGRRSELLDYSQSKESCLYRFSVGEEPLAVEGKSKKEYNRLNSMKPIEGFTLNEAVKKGVFNLRNGRELFFRDRRVTLTENTMFHLAGNSGLLLDRVSGISHDFFREVVDERVTAEKKLLLLKNLLQCMGWGVVRFLMEGDTIIMKIKNPPFGLQDERDNWGFLSKTIQGYLWLVDEGYLLETVGDSETNLVIKYFLD